MLALKLGVLNWILRSHVVEEENYLWKAVFWLPHVTCSLVYTHTNTLIHALHVILKRKSYSLKAVVKHLVLLCDLSSLVSSLCSVSLTQTGSPESRACDKRLMYKCPVGKLDSREWDWGEREKKKQERGSMHWATWSPRKHTQAHPLTGDKGVFPSPQWEIHWSILAPCASHLHMQWH